MRLFRWIAAVVFVAACATAGIAAFTVYDEIWTSLPPLDKLLDYDPPEATRVYAADGSLLEEFYLERRYLTPIDKIPVFVRQAFVAAEDSDFYSHHGVDVVGIVRAFIANALAGEVVQGGSTITQQVVKAFLLSPERSYERKLREILLAFRLEQKLTKDQILGLYLNQIYLGAGNYGVEAAARSYFGKNLDQLTVAEAAMLAGLPAAPSRFSPLRNPDAARTRQRYVLRRMREEGFITAGAYHEALREGLTVAELHADEQPATVRNYYTEAVRLHLEDMFGKEAPYDQGYKVYTSVDPKLQAEAERSVRNGIEKIDLELGYRGPVEHLDAAAREKRIASDTADASLAELDPEHIYRAVVTKAGKDVVGVRLGPWQSEVDVKGLRWSRKVSPQSFSVGDVIEVRARKAGAATADEHPIRPAPGEHPQLFVGETPKIEAAMVAIDVKSGQLAAMVGGYDFLSSQFNRATQAKRQPGSAFKPFIYSAALDNGYTPASIIYDEPVQYDDNGKIWEPRNYSRKYYGPTRLRTALEHSRNVVTVKLLDAIGVDTVVDYIERFHFDATIGRHLSIALGTSEMTLLDLTSGYTAFANGGVKVEPTLIERIEDSQGRVFYTNHARRREVLTPETAALMTQLLEGVIQHGTATGVRPINRPAAGKTGTTNDQKDAWFIGYTPSLVVGVWVGYDDHSHSMGTLGTGGHMAAPIWLEFMRQALADAPVRDFEIPEGIRCVNIDPRTGFRATTYTDSPQLECFKSGTEPQEYVPVWVWGPGGQEPGTNTGTERDAEQSPPATDSRPQGAPSFAPSPPDGGGRYPSDAADPDARYRRGADSRAGDNFRFYPSTGEGRRGPAAPRY